MVKRRFLFVIMVLISLCIRAQKVIQMEKENGVYKISCTVNGAKMKMIFDTGAAAVSLSMPMANYLYENDYITKDDIIGSGRSQTADGTIVDHIVINLRDIEISGLHIKNIKATVIASQNAPLLLGQSAIQKLGPVTIQGNRLIINSVSSPLPEEEILKLEHEADSLYQNRKYYAAAVVYSKLRDYPGLNTEGYYRLFISLYYSSEYDKALDVFRDWETDQEFSKASDSEKATFYGSAGLACLKKKEYLMGISYLKTELAMKEKAGEQISADDYSTLAHAYDVYGDFGQSINYRRISIYRYCKDHNYLINDFYNGMVKDEYLLFLIGQELISYAFTLSAKNDFLPSEAVNFLIIGAAKCGDETAIDWCLKYKLSYKDAQFDNNYNYLF